MRVGAYGLALGAGAAGGTGKGNGGAAAATLVAGAASRGAAAGTPGLEPAQALTNASKHASGNVRRELSIMAGSRKMTPWLAPARERNERVWLSCTDTVAAELRES